jgi:hypothetical protein
VADLLAAEAAGARPSSVAVNTGIAEIGSYPKALTILVFVK